MIHLRVSALKNRTRRIQQSRRGAVLVWFIVAMPELLTLLCVMLEVANLYLARTELQDALEAGAQAAVKDWADNFNSTAGDTQHARIVGNAFATANTINGVPVNLTSIDPALNYSSGSLCNQNASSRGVFVFGAVSSTNPEFGFDCCSVPLPCGVGNILFDASGEENLSSGNNNEWGIRFLDQAIVPANLLITRIQISLSGGASFIPGTFALADAIPPFKVVDQSPATPDAPDLFGLTAPQISSTFQSGNTVLVLTFSAAGPDPGFEKGDRFRFGAAVDAPGPGNSQLDGDEVGQAGTQAQIRVEFSNGSIASGVLVDTHFGGQFGPPPPGAACASTGIYDPAHQSLTVFPLPNPIADLPCPPASAANNDGQSYVQLQGNGGGFNNAFAVRAQTTYPVPSICCNLFGLPVGPFTVTATADALYDCTTRTPRLYHLEQRNIACPLNGP